MPTTITALGLERDEGLLVRWLHDPDPARLEFGWLELARHARRTGRDPRGVLVAALADIRPEEISAAFTTVGCPIRPFDSARTRQDKAELITAWTRLACLVEQRRARAMPAAAVERDHASPPPQDVEPGSGELRRTALKIYGGGRPAAAMLERRMREARAQHPGESPHALLQRVVDEDRYRHWPPTDPRRAFPFHESDSGGRRSPYDFYSSRSYRAPTDRP